ncbi:hypothetical protein XFF6992_170118 [Xanthomonas citri pv. fuscans]|nr:hypothetical protein XFF6992_170118 [Xanthomonas citri pv. fuscans]SOO36315.1 hypothetical protein XFF6994_940018 [Xanthomonas citri pv. fuscans]
MPAHRRGTLGGMETATELTGTYLQRVRDGERARAKQPGRTCSALQPTHPHRSITLQGNRDMSVQRRSDAHKPR